MRGIFSACRCLSKDDISNSIRAIAAINPRSTTGGSTSPKISVFRVRRDELLASARAIS